MIPLDLTSVRPQDLVPGDYLCGEVRGDDTVDWAVYRFFDGRLHLVRDWCKVARTIDAPDETFATYEEWLIFRLPDGITDQNRFVGSTV